MQNVFNVPYGFIMRFRILLMANVGALEFHVVSSNGSIKSASKNVYSFWVNEGWRIGTEL